jgi:hypothetical protein
MGFIMVMLQKINFVESYEGILSNSSAILILPIFLGMNSQSVTKNVFKHVKSGFPNLFQ